MPDAYPRVARRKPKLVGDGKRRLMTVDYRTRLIDEVKKAPLFAVLFVLRIIYYYALLARTVLTTNIEEVIARQTAIIRIEKRTLAKTRAIMDVRR